MVVSEGIYLKDIHEYQDYVIDHSTNITEISEYSKESINWLSENSFSKPHEILRLNFQK